MQPGSALPALPLCKHRRPSCPPGSRAGRRDRAPRSRRWPRFRRRRRSRSSPAAARSPAAISSSNGSCGRWSCWAPIGLRLLHAARHCPGRPARERRKRRRSAAAARSNARTEASNGALDLDRLERHLLRVGAVERTPFLVRARIGAHELTVFPGGRAIVQETTDTALARSLTRATSGPSGPGIWQELLRPRPRVIELDLII